VTALVLFSTTVDAKDIDGVTLLFNVLNPRNIVPVSSTLMGLQFLVENGVVQLNTVRWS